MSDTTWRKEIMLEMAKQGESWELVLACTLSDAQLDREFDDGFGAEEGEPFTLWTRSRVYFPWCYDGTEGCASVPRHPCDEATRHVGG